MHKFHLGQMVTYESPNGTWAPRGEFVVTAQLPERDGEFEYRIRSAMEQHDRMVSERADRYRRRCTGRESEAVMTGNEASQPPRPRATTMDEYNAKQEAERAKMAKLRALRLAAEATAGVKPKGKRKATPIGKEKR
jgi:hypothetical protein